MKGLKERVEGILVKYSNYCVDAPVKGFDCLDEDETTTAILRKHEG